jgi:hypothetical protein
MKSKDFLTEGQIYSTGGGAGEGQRWYKPRSAPNQHELEKVDEATVDDQESQKLPKESAIMKGLQTEEAVNENLRKWFKEKWVRFGPDGKIRGACARGDDSEGKPKCLPQSKAHSLGKKGRASAAARKRREDPNPERRGPAKNVATKKKTSEGLGDTKTDILGTYKGYKFVIETQTEDDRYVKFYSAIGPDGKEHRLPKGTTVEEFKKFVDSKQGVAEEKCPHCGGAMFSELMINEKKDACYYKVKSRYKVWPSAYASGALVKCRKKGASNWGTGGKKNEGTEQFQPKLKYEEYLELANEIQKRFNDAVRTNNTELAKEIEQERIALDKRAKQGLTLENLGMPYPGTYEQETLPYRTKGQKRTQSIAFETKQIEEKWSEKYKKSINCNNPKGFSQRAHCQGRKKK